jgi:predicted  nucleic acid-binding Zn-ribbon protein
MESQIVDEAMIEWGKKAIVESLERRIKELGAEVERLESALEKLEGDYDTALEWNIELAELLASAQAKAEVERRVLEKLWGAARRHITELEAEVEWGARG